MPRRSAASLAIVPPTIAHPRLRASPTLSDSEREVFDAVVAAMPAAFFGPSDRFGLEALARHTAMAEKLAGTLEELNPTSPEFARVSTQQVAHSRAALAMSRSLRIVLNARVAPDKKHPNGPATFEQLKARYAAQGADE